MVSYAPSLSQDFGDAPPYEVRYAVQITARHPHIPDHSVPRRTYFESPKTQPGLPHRWRIPTQAWQVPEYLWVWRQHFVVGEKAQVGQRLWRHAGCTRHALIDSHITWTYGPPPL